MSIVVIVEEGAKLQAIDGDPSTVWIGKVLSIVPEGRPDPGQAHIFACGTRAGIRRMAGALRAHA